MIFLLMDNENNPIEVFIIEHTCDIYSSEILISVFKDLKI